LYSMQTVLIVEASKLLVASSTITIRTSGLQGTIIRLHIGDMIAYYHPSLCTFENICVIIWSILLYSEEIVQSVEESKGWVESSTITIPTSWLKGTIMTLQHDSLLLSHFVVIWKYWCNLEYSVVRGTLWRQF
jgi:hypothetical protein